MDIPNFSKQQFESLRVEKNDLAMHLRALDEYICARVNKAISEEMEQIVLELNALGHQLKRNTNIEEIGETDFCEHHEAKSCGFRIGSNLVISSGYYGVADCDIEIA